jgi:hypothetical protein
VVSQASSASSWPDRSCGWRSVRPAPCSAAG